ncbi:MAG: hypothetical protein L0332_05030 [Chloroflexi bacterium]|nr:hypothetical protein [Chloroflexota bacterium]MCI0577849.1 hypothetical protein [Chloroflexota bacterium]MCI0643831.1 hypothetical protein [Chloroflexota bacterium]MCI0726071.1 hypothetical protein [Chloroflexota bacterium]
MADEQLPREVASFFRDQFRRARITALQDAEGFQEILFALERFGICLTGEINTLKGYKDAIISEAKRSHLAVDIPKEHKAWHSGFSEIYELVREARNDALHQGAFARHLTNNAIQLALILEDALMTEIEDTIGNFMVREPVCASLWQPLSFIRQQMLKNAFTYLPLCLDGEDQPRWYLVSDYRVAQYLRQGDRKKRLAKTLKSAREEGLILEPAHTCLADTKVAEALEMSDGKPMVVIDEEHPTQIVGIATPFDFL